jgi:hypothetical protein
MQTNQPQIFRQFDGEKMCWATRSADGKHLLTGYETYDEAKDAADVLKQLQH